ncbi:MAG: sporulation protein YqfD [Clostridia bacterium]
MLIKIFVKIILGYVKIEVEGYYIERFINICMAKKIFLWNVKREKSTIMYANIGIDDFKRLTEVAKKTKCKVKIKEKKGVPFFLHKYKKRKIFGIFLCLIVFFLMVMSNFIWNIEIQASEEINQEELLATLEQEGLKVGKLKKDIDTKDIINKLRFDREDLAWVGISIEGTNAIVKVVSADKKPEIINEEDYCNIVSDKEGMIVKVEAINGTPLVKEGDIVKKGTVLIGGYLEGQYTGTRYVHSNGTITAKVWYSKKEKFNLNQIEERTTGNEEKKYCISINNFKINLNKRVSKFKKYDTINEEKKLQLFSNFYLPVEFIITTNKEKESISRKYTPEEAKNLVVARLEEELEKEFDKENVVDKHINFYESTNSVEVEVVYEVLENIGTKEKIAF